MEYLLGFLIGVIICFIMMVSSINSLLDSYVKNKHISRKGKVYKIVEIENNGN